MGYPATLTGPVRKVTSTIYTFSTSFTRFNRIQIGARMTILKSSSSNSFIIYSTIPYDATVIKSIDDSMIQNGDLQQGQSFMDTLTHIIIPDREHTMAVLGYKKKVPSVKIIGMEGCSSEINAVIDYKFIKAQQNIVFSKEKLVSDLKLNPETDSSILEDFEFVYFPAHRNQELVAFHRPTKTLLEGDLLFLLKFDSVKSPNSDVHNEQFQTVDPTKGFFGSLAKKALNKNTWLGRKFASAAIADVNSAKAGFKAINTWDFEKIIPCHGDVIDRNGKDEFRAAFPAMV